MKAKTNHDINPSIEPVNPHLADFNFEQWARQVRPLLLASLQKRNK
jgi:hypothetical protein